MSESTKEVRDVWTQWLKQWDWEWFVTPIFRDNVGVDAPERRWKKWVNAINNYIDDRVGYFRARGGIRTEKCSIFLNLLTERFVNLKVVD